jgi:hypothetical protein
MKQNVLYMQQWRQHNPFLNNFLCIHYIESLFEWISVWLCIRRLGIISLGCLESQVIGLLMSWTTDLLLFKVSHPLVLLIR